MNVYGNRTQQARKSALMKIVEGMALDDFGIENVKQKIKSLRTTYQQEQSKIEKSRSSTDDVDEVYKPPMKWFYIIHDIMKTVQLKRNNTHRNMDITITHGDTQMEDEDNIDNVFENKEGILSTMQSKKSVVASPSSTSQRNITLKRRATSTPKNKRSKTKICQVAETVGSK